MATALQQERKKESKKEREKTARRDLRTRVVVVFLTRMVYSLIEF